jgi:hypothetical protein
MANTPEDEDYIFAPPKQGSAPAMFNTWEEDDAAFAAAYDQGVLSQKSPYALTPAEIETLPAGAWQRRMLARDRRLLQDPSSLESVVPGTSANAMDPAEFAEMMRQEKATYESALLDGMPVSSDAAVLPTKAASKGAPTSAAAGRGSKSRTAGAGGLTEQQAAAIGAATALAGGALQYFGAVKPATQTTQDLLNQQRLAELRKKEADLKRGQPSTQDVQELAFLESAQMNPVRALATQQMQRGEAERASMGATRAARQALESERIGRQQVTQAAQQVGLQKAQRFLQQRAEKKADLARTQREIDERTAYESGVERNRLAFIGDTITGVTGLVGKALGGYVPTLEGPSAAQRDAFRTMYPDFKDLPDSTVDAAIEGLVAARSSR